MNIKLTNCQLGDMHIVRDLHHSNLNYSFKIVLVRTTGEVGARNGQVSQNVGESQTAGDPSVACQSSRHNDSLTTVRRFSR